LPQRTKQAFGTSEMIGFGEYQRQNKIVISPKHFFTLREACLSNELLTSENKVDDLKFSLGRLHQLEKCYL
jgi:hypothetical protein